MPTALVFTYRDLLGLRSAAAALHLPDALLDVPHWGFVPVGGFDVRGGPPGHLPGVTDAHTSLLFALDRWLVTRYLLPTPWGKLLRPDSSATFRHGFDEQASVADIRGELEAGGYVVIDWATARRAMQPQRPDTGFLAAARALAASPDPARAPVPCLAPKVDLDTAEDDDAIRRIARAGQLWRMRWFWNTAFDGDPDDAFRVEALAREGGAGDHDWARFIALAPCDHDHPPVQLWLLAHLHDLDGWLTRACAGHPDDLGWIAAAVREHLSKIDGTIDPLTSQRKRMLDKLARLAKGKKPAPDPRHGEDPDTIDPAYSQRLALLLLTTPGQEAAARALLAENPPPGRGGAMAGLCALVRLTIDDPARPVHAPDLADGLARLGWSLAGDPDARASQRRLRARAPELDEALAHAARTDLAAVQAGVFGVPRFDRDPEATPRRRDTPRILDLLLRGELDDCEVEPVGALRVTSGRITATDPLTSADRPAFVREAPRGEHPVDIARDEFGSVGALIVRFAGAGPAARWTLAVRPGEDPENLAPGHVFGFPVDTGIAAVFDAETAAILAAQDDVLEKLIEPALADVDAAVITVRGAGGSAAVTRSGDGDGYYAAWWALDARGEPAALVVDFGLLDAPAADDERDQATLAGLAPWTTRARTVLDDTLAAHDFAPAEVVLDRDNDEVRVVARRGEETVELSVSFSDDPPQCTGAADIRAFVAGEECEAMLDDADVPDLGDGPYATLAAIDARLLRAGAAFVAAIQPP